LLRRGRGRVRLPLPGQRRDRGLRHRAVVSRAVHDHHRGPRLDPRIVPGRRVHRAGADLPHQCSAPAAPAHARRAAEAGGADGVRRLDHLLPDRRAVRTRSLVADHQGKTTAVAVPTLRRRPRMTLSVCAIALLSVVVPARPALAPAPGGAQGKDIFVPLLVYRTGPFAPSGIPIANGFVDYFTLVNERDGGINGVKIAWEECETQYDTKQGVECYERLKGKGAALVNP